MLYRIHTEDGDDLGEAAFGYYVRPGDDLWISREGRPHHVRVLDLVPMEEEDESRYEGLLSVQSA